MVEDEELTELELEAKYFDEMMSKRWSRWLFYLFALLNWALFCYVIWVFIELLM